MINKEQFHTRRRASKLAVSTIMIASTLALGMASPSQAAETVDPGPVGAFSWKGLNWDKRTDRGAPMYNGNFDPANVVNPDANGYVKLKLTNPTGNSPQAAEFMTTKAGGFGYGTYTVVVQKDLTKMQDEVVWGCMFTYDPTTSPGYNEIDLCEASAWGGGGTANWDPTQGHGYWFDAAAGPGKGNSVETFPVPVSPVQTHKLVWEKDRLVFYTFAGEGTTAPLAKKTVLTGANVPEPANERIHFNLWVVGGNGGNPDKVSPEEVTIKNFSFVKGTPTEPEIVQTAIAQKAGSLYGSLGAATTGEVYGLKDGGGYQGFERGYINWSPATGAHITRGGIRGEWLYRNAENGPLGYPVSDEYTVGTSVIQNFQGGSIVWSETTGLKTVVGAINTAWKGYGSQTGLGLPTSNQVASVNGGAYQVFEKGSIYWSSVTGAKLVNGAIRGAYLSFGAEKSVLGYPKTAEIRNLKNGGVKQEFQGGHIYWSSTSGAWISTGKIRAKWLLMNAENGRLGYPTSNEYSITGGKAQNYQGGKISLNSTTGKFMVTYK